MRREPAVVVERQIEAGVTVADALYPADEHVFHDLSGLEGGQGYMRFVTHVDLETVVGGELFLFLYQLCLELSAGIDDEQVFRPFPSFFRLTARTRMSDLARRISLPAKGE